MKKTANELLTWLTKIKAESVLKDLDDILEAHFDAPEHMRDARLIPGSDVKVKWCEHWSEYVLLACQRELNEAGGFRHFEADSWHGVSRARIPGGAVSRILC